MKYVVIFKAKIKQFDEHYAQTAQLLREKALTEFHCQHFEALCENDQEIALSYWNQLEDIQAGMLMQNTLQHSSWAKHNGMHISV